MKRWAKRNTLRYSQRCQPPPDPGRADPISAFIYAGQWREGFEAQDLMLDEFEKKFGLEDQDWREGYWDK